MDKYRLAVNTLGAAGNASGSAQTPTPVQGRLYAVHVDYASNAPATTDLVVDCPDSPAQTFLSLANVSTDGWYYPRQAVHGSTGSALAYQGTADVSIPADLPAVHGHIRASVAGADALSPAATVTVYLVS